MTVSGQKPMALDSETSAASGGQRPGGPRSDARSSVQPINGDSAHPHPGGMPPLMRQFRMLECRVGGVLSVRETVGRSLGAEVFSQEIDRGGQR